MTPEGTNCRTGAHFPTQRLGRTSQRSMPGSKRSKTFSTVSPSRPALDHQLMTYIQPGFRLGATILCCGEGIAQVETLNEFHDDKLSILSGEPSPFKRKDTHTAGQKDKDASREAQIQRKCSGPRHNRHYIQ